MCKLVVQSKWAMYYLLVSLNPRTDFRAFGGIDSWHLSNMNKYCFSFDGYCETPCSRLGFLKSTQKTGVRGIYINRKRHWFCIHIVK